MRLDVFLQENEFFESREKAKRAVEEGRVAVNGKQAIKPSLAVSADDSVIVTLPETPDYVGRGGKKLEGALSYFQLDVHGMTAIDIGASTGGFTDCLLQRGAAKVFAVDAGKDQLHKSLKHDPRVISMEETNARNLIKDQFYGAKIDLVVMDVSFISQTLLYETVCTLLRDGGYFLSLIKPQFEVGKGNIGKNGIVKSEAVRKKTVEKIKQAAEACCFKTLGIMDSPIFGGDGNKEYLALFRLERDEKYQ